MLAFLRLDLQHALRTLRQNPAFTLVAVLTLALGIGANSAVFSVVDAVLLHPLPYPEPQQLVSLHSRTTRAGATNQGLSVPEFEDLRDQSGVFEHLSVVWPMDGNLTGIDRPERIEALAVSPNYFPMLGARARLGRVFEPNDGRYWMSESAVLSDAAWRRLFGADPHILGRKIRLDYDRFVIVGVMAPNFRHPGATLQGSVDIWIAGNFRGGAFPLRPERGMRMLPGALGRLRPGLTLQQARARLQDTSRAFARLYPADYPTRAGWVAWAEPLREALAGSSTRILWLLFGAVGLVLVACCASIANLLLARTTARGREFATRAALGATTGDLVRQLSCETLLLASAGGVGGLLIAHWVAPWLAAATPLEITPVNPVQINPGVLAFSLAAVALTTLLAGLAPVAFVLRLDLLDSMRQGSRTHSSGPRGNRSRALLVCAQMALSVLLLVGGGLLSRSLWSLLGVNPGFNPKGVTVASLWLAPPGDPTERRYETPEARAALVRKVLDQVRAVPGVEAAAMGSGNSIPLVGSGTTPFVLDRSTQPGEMLAAQLTSVTPDYFRVMQTPLLAGRVFSEADDGRNPIALIDQPLAHSLFNAADPIGRRIGLGPENQRQWRVIVGVVGGVKTRSLDAPETPHIYVPLYDRSSYGMSVLLRSGLRSETLLEPLRRAVRSVDPDQPVFGVRPLEEVLARTLAERRFAWTVICAFALLVLGFACIGVYGLTAFAVEQRTREIGLRIALGASSRQILRIVLRQGLSLAAIGILAGAAGAAGLTRFLRGFLYGTAASDPGTYIGVAALLGVTALLACYVPARRAARLNPIEALRSE